MSMNSFGYYCETLSFQEMKLGCFDHHYLFLELTLNLIVLGYSRLSFGPSLARQTSYNHPVVPN